MENLTFLATCLFLRKILTAFVIIPYCRLPTRDSTSPHPCRSLFTSLTGGTPPSKPQRQTSVYPENHSKLGREGLEGGLTAERTKKGLSGGGY
ncbi:hypothetical protein EDB19DRAFT_1737488 [Suillus lakei]|nr:hypothetical protein EDB19DRAFT_1737488 [Suillus lakei]